MSKTTAGIITILQLICVLFLICGINAAAQEKERFLYTLPTYKDVVIQKDIEYRKTDKAALKFDFYRLPLSGKNDAQPVVIFMNSSGGAAAKNSPFQVEWAKTCASAEVAAVTFESHFDGQRGDNDLLLRNISEDFDLLVNYLRANQAKLGIDANKIIVHASSGNAVIGFPIVMDKNRSFVKAAVIYYGSAEIKDLRLDLPVFFVRAGLDEPGLNRRIDALLGKALATNAPFEIVNHPGGHHPFEIDSVDNEMSREIIARTIAFMHKAVSPGVQKSIQTIMDEAIAGAAMLNENWSAAVTSYSALIKNHSNDPEMHRRYADALFGAKEYDKAVKEYELAFTLGSWRKRDISYPASVASTKTGDTELTLKWLNRLVNTPFNRASLLTDPNFESLRSNDRFIALTQNSGK